MDDNLSRVYNTLQREGYELPEYDIFAKDMQDDKNLRQVRESLIRSGYAPPEFEEFKYDMFSSPPPAPSPADKAQYTFTEEQPIKNDNYLLPIVICETIFSLFLIIFICYTTIKRRKSKNGNKPNIEKMKPNIEKMKPNIENTENTVDIESMNSSNIKEEEYNSLFSCLLGLWLISGVIAFIPNFTKFLLICNTVDDSSLKMVSIIIIVLNLIVIVGSVLILSYNKLGFYLLLVASVLNFVALFLGEDMYSSLAGSFGFILFYILFFTLKKNGKTPFKILFSKGNKKMIEKDSDVESAPKMIEKDSDVESAPKKSIIKRGKEAINDKFSFKFKFNYVYAKRVFIVICVVLGFALAYIFALNGRYESVGGVVYDKWLQEYVYRN